MGEVAIDSSTVEPLPSSETIVEIKLEQTRSDKAWSQFPLRTTERPYIVCPGTVGSQRFAERATQCDAMLRTPEGQAFLAGLASDLAAQPLEAKSKVEIVEKQV